MNSNKYTIERKTRQGYPYVTNEKGTLTLDFVKLGENEVVLSGRYIKRKTAQ